MSLRQIDIFALFSEVEVVPQAILGLPLSFAEEVGFKLETGTDLFDNFTGFALYWENGPSIMPDCRFAIMRYDGYPERTSTFYLPRTLNDVDQITQVVLDILEELRISPDELIWQRKDNPEL